MTVADLKVGQYGIISGFSTPEIETVMLEIGFSLHQRLEVSQIAPFKGPIAVNLGSSVLTLRQDEAQGILLKEEVFR
ncbi:MAG: ferrous iron transport protein A [Bacteroidetes bacterium]|nr:ferrous iron transport protein A [Bacteroidota bacterium]